MKKNICICIIFFILQLFFCIYAYPQTRSGAERAIGEADRLFSPDKIRDKIERPPKKEPIATPEPEPAPIKSGKKFFTKKIKLIGCESYPPEEFRKLTDKYANKELVFSDLEMLAKKIERDYLQKGIIAAVFIPPQEVKDGVVTLRVVEARFGNLQVKESKYFNKNRLYYYWKIAPGEILRYDRISKSVQMMNKNPDREVKAILAAGKKPGTTDVILDTKTSFPAHITFTFDNEGTYSTGRTKTGLGIRHNNFLGFDDTLLEGTSFGKSFSGTYTYHSIPITPNGTSLFYGYSRSLSMPLKEFAPLSIKSQSKTTTVSLRQDIFKDDQYLGEVTLGFDAKDKVTHSTSGTIDRDCLRILSLGGSYMKRGFGSTTILSGEFNQGLPFFGASPKDNPIASRGGQAKFAKMTLGMQYRKLLPLKFQGNLKLKTQLAFSKLTAQEGFALGGIDSVRGYPSSDFIADNAVQINAELLVPGDFIPASWHFPYAKAPLKDDVTPVIFMDYGWGNRRGLVSSDEQKSVTDISIGAGLRIRTFDQALLRLEWGVPIGNNPISEAGRTRFHFSVDVQEKLPEEIERMKKAIEEAHIEQWAWQIVNEQLSKPSSAAGKKIRYYKYMAEEAYRIGDLEASKEYYQKVEDIGRSIYTQAREYVTANIAKEKELLGYKKLALENHKKGKFKEEKDLWSKIINEPQIKPLMLEF